MSGSSNLFKDMGPAKLGIMAIVTVAIIISMIFLSNQLSKPAVVPLFSGLDAQDSGKIAAKLEMMGVYYELRSGGAQIVVQRDKVLTARMGLAEDGLPTGRANVGYELFDKDDKMGASSFVNDVNLVRALEGELGRTIGSFAQVDSARVHVVMPKKNLFSRSKEEPSASVVLKMRGGQSLSQSQITAISHLVATAVPGLSVDRITIVDVQGRPFKKGAVSHEDPAAMAEESESYRVQYEKRMKDVIEDLLSRSVGAGKVEAQVSAEIDFDKIVIDTETYDPNGQVVRSVQTTEERANSNEGNGGNVTAGNNVPGGNASETTGGAASNNETVNEVTNYEISKTIQKQVKEVGNIKKLSIAVLVDGKYEYDDQKEIYNYIPRSDEELQKIEALVKSAVGYNEQRGDSVKVVNMQFSNEVVSETKEEKFAWITRDFGSIIQTLVIGIVITMVILLIVKPMVGRAFEITRNESEEMELQAALAGGDLDELAELTGVEEIRPKKENLIDIEKLEERMNSSSIATINDIIARHPEEAVTIIRHWIEEA